jgi:hypothetical protein
MELLFYVANVLFNAGMENQCPVRVWGQTLELWLVILANAN